MQSPPPTYEQAQKHSAPFESPNDPAPPAYAYENPINIRDEHPPTTRYFQIFHFLSIFALNLTNEVPVFMRKAYKLRNGVR